MPRRALFMPPLPSREQLASFYICPGRYEWIATCTTNHYVKGRNALNPTLYPEYNVVPTQVKYCTYVKATTNQPAQVKHVILLSRKSNFKIPTQMKSIGIVFSQKRQ